MRSIVCAALTLVLGWGSPAFSQQVFHSVQSANLPTAETLPRGSWLFEISHRFDTPFSAGGSDFWGVDGPAYSRLGLSYAAHDRVLLAIQRSNVEDNTEMNAKVGLWQGGTEGMPVKVALMAGVAVNTQVFEVDGAEDNESQQYAELLVNALLGDRLAVGIVPAYLRNPRLRDFDADNTFAVGLQGQYYLTGSMSLLGEWLVSESSTDRPSDAGSFGVEFQTRGHFFKLLVTNQARLNPTQFLAGSNVDFEPHEWRAGFNITRLLPF